MSNELDGCIITFSEVKSRLENLENELAAKLYIRKNFRLELIQMDRAGQLDNNDPLVKDWRAAYSSYLNSESFNLQIESLKQELLQATTDNAEIFASLIKKSLVFLDRHEFTRALDISQPALDRWLNGRGAPHPIMRKVYYTLIIRQLDKII